MGSTAAKGSIASAGLAAAGRGLAASGWWWWSYKFKVVDEKGGSSRPEASSWGVIPYLSLDCEMAW